MCNDMVIRRFAGGFVLASVVLAWLVSPWWLLFTAFVGVNLLQSSVNDLGLSARAHDKVLRVARTIADLEASDKIEPHHITEAINYRMLDRQLWT